RSQLQWRNKFGILEKHKDYVERATAFLKKEDIIKIQHEKLKEKALFKNPDELIKTKMVDGVHRIESNAKQYIQEELTLMKTQDIGYLFQKIQKKQKKYNYSLRRRKSYLSQFKFQIPLEGIQLSLIENWERERRGSMTWRNCIQNDLAEGTTEKWEETLTS
ncbi:embryo sac development arrest, partial [Thalictrum thalictroides]